MTKQDDKTPIILCAGEHGRCVVFGYVSREPVPGEPVRLEQARMVLRWCASGLFGLAAEGPREGSRLTAAVESTVATRWTEWLAVSPMAAVRMGEWPSV